MPEASPARRIASIVPVILCIVACGCSGLVKSANPLSVPADTRLEHQYMGTWKSKDGPDNVTNFLHIGAAGKDFPAYVMRILFVSQPKDDKTTVEYDEFLGFFTKIDNEYYFNLILPPKLDLSSASPSRIDKWEAGAVHSYMLYKVKKSGEDLEVLSMDVDAVKKFVADGNISGQMEKSSDGKVTGVSLTATTPELRQFLSARTSNTVFRTSSWRFTPVK